MSESPKKRGRKPKIEKVTLEKKVTEIPTPKKRGRKPKKSDKLEKPTKSAKKRGRKPKKKPNEVAQTQPKKRGRKPKPKVYGVVTSPTTTRLRHDDENIILQLPIKEDQLTTYQNRQKTMENDLLFYNPEICIPKPYSTSTKHDQVLTTICELINETFCDKCTYTEEGSLIKCENCSNIFNQLTQQKQTLETLLSQREQDDKEYRQKQPRVPMNSVKFLTQQIKDKALPKNSKLPEYNPDDLVASDKDEKNIPNYQGIENIHIDIEKQQGVSHANSELAQMYSQLQAYTKTLLERIKQLETQIEFNDRAILNGHNGPNAQTQETNVCEKSKNSHKNANRTFNLLTCFDPEDWPDSTSVACWWDCHSFEGPPIPLPIEYDERLGKYKVFGCFCSFNCALAYNNAARYPVQTSMIYRMFYKICGMIENCEKISSPKEALPRETLELFGGELSVEEFRKDCVNPHLKYNILVYPYAAVSQNIQVLYRKNSDKLFQVSEQSEDSGKLRLKRNKPLPNVKNTLEASFKIKRI